MEKKNRIFLYISTIPSRRVSHECLGKAVAHYISSGACAEADSGRPFFPAGPPSGWRLEREGAGKPCFPDAPMIHFSISHSGSLWICAISGQPVGADIQERRWREKEENRKGESDGEEDREGGRRRISCTLRIADRFFHPAERQFLADRDSGREKEGTENFFDVWAAKESYVKYTGEGIRRDFRSFAVADREGLLSCMNTPLGGNVMFRHLSLDSAYSFCICAENIGEIRCVRLTGDSAPWDAGSL